MSAHPRLSINQATIKHATLDEALQATVAGGVEAIGLPASRGQPSGLQAEAG